MNTEPQPTELLSTSFSASLKDDVVGCLSDIIEVGLDSVSEDGIIKDIPFISTAISMYRIGHSIHDRHSLKKLAVFLDQINQGIQNESTRQRYIKKFQENKKFRDKELEFVLILIDRYIGYDKPQMLAKLFLSYLNEDITWTEFSVYAEVVDRFLSGDAELLCTDFPLRRSREKEHLDSLARLVSLGLMSERMKLVSHAGRTLTLSDGTDKEYQMTKFGHRLASILK